MRSGAYKDAAITFQAALDRDANSRTAMKGWAAANFLAASEESDPMRAALYDLAARMEKRLIALDARDESAYYALGAIEWAQCYGAIQEKRAASNMASYDPAPIPDFASRQALQAKYGATIEDGITNLKKAMELAPGDGDAMAYLNLLLRERVNLRDTPELASADLREADSWMQSAIRNRRIKGLSQVAGAAESPDFRPAPPPPPPAPDAQNTDPKTIRVAGNVAEGNLIRKIDPVYPALALQARVQGTVRFSIVIAKDGTISHMQLISGHPLLVAAAQQALMQWVYRPTLVNGEPVEVVTVADILFALV